MSDLVFDIKNLITPFVKERFSKCKSIEEQVRLLIELTEFDKYYDPEESREIADFYEIKTGEPYTKVYLTNSNRDLLNEYGKTFKNFKDLRHLINKLCDPETAEEAEIEASEQLNDKRNKQNVVAESKEQETPKKEMPTTPQTPKKEEKSSPLNIFRQHSQKNNK